MNHHQNDAKHWLIMLACCLIPVALIIGVGVFGLTLGALTPLLPFAFVVLCPVLMFFMMRGMMNDHGEAEHRPSGALKAPEGQTASEQPHVH